MGIVVNKKHYISIYIFNYYLHQGNFKYPRIIKIHQVLQKLQVEQLYDFVKLVVFYL